MSLSPAMYSKNRNRGALIFRIGFGGIVYYNHNIDPPQKKNTIHIIKALTLLSMRLPTCSIVVPFGVPKGTTMEPLGTADRNSK